MNIKRLIGSFLIFITYSIGILTSRLFRNIKLRKVSTNRIIINGTFHNPNWFFAHIEPIVRCNYAEVILVCDEPMAELPNLTYSCPPTWLSKLLSRAVAKFIYTLLNGIKYPADIYVGYHIFPSALTALICSRLLGGKCCYQVTSGQLEIEGGGWHSENKLLTMLGSASSIIERKALQLTNEFDLLIVRGNGAKHYLLDHGIDKRIEIVTGSVLTDVGSIDNERNIDVIFVGRLTEYKRPDVFMKVMSKVVKALPECSIKVVGEGPDSDYLESMIRDENITQNVEMLGKRSDVPDLLKQSKLLVMTSRWEGVSIAMLEAMAMGVVPVVSDVGDLRDYVINDVTGYVLEKDDLDGFVQKIVYLLSNPAIRDEMAVACHTKVDESSSKSAITKKWLNLFMDLGEKH